MKLYVEFLQQCHKVSTELITEDGTKLGIRKDDVVCYFAGLRNLDEKVFPDPYRYKYDRFVVKTLMDFI